MNEIFADAGYWIALFHPRDRLHSKALVVSQSVGRRPLLVEELTELAISSIIKCCPENYRALARVWRLSFRTTSRFELI